MKGQADGQDKVSAILKKDGLEKPDEKFSQRMKHFLVEKYRYRETKGLERNQWPARIVSSMAIVWCAILLYHVSSFVVKPMGFAVATFLLGLLAVIVLVRMQRVS